MLTDNNDTCVTINNNKLLGDRFTAAASKTTEEGVLLVLLGEGAAAFGNHGATTASRGEGVDFEAPGDICLVLVDAEAQAMLATPIVPEFGAAALVPLHGVALRDLWSFKGM